MTEKNKIVIPTKSLTLHSKLKDDLLSDFTQIPQIPTTSSPQVVTLTPSKTTLIINSIARAGYFRPKSKGAEVNVQPHKVYPNYMKRDPREYPPIHCCAWRPKSTTGEVDVIQPVLPRTKHVHHTLFDAGKYINVKESPTVKAVNKTVFGKTITTPINLLSSDSFQFDTLKGENRILDTEMSEHNGEDMLRESGMTSFSKIISPGSSKGFDGQMEFRRTFKGDPVKMERYRERYEATQSDFKKIQLRIDELARRKRGWYQENVNEALAVKEKIVEGSLLLKSMDSSHHREEMRHAVRLSKVHAHYEKNWKKMGSVSNDKNGNEDSMRISHSKLRLLVNENKKELSKVFNTTNSARKQEKILV